MREGTEVGSTDATGSGEFTVPAALGGYHLEVDAGDEAWTFCSEHMSGADARPLPLMAARVTPRLDRQV